jgi:Tol biopolymer transport system component
MEEKMKRIVITSIVILVIVAVLMGCSPATPAPTQTPIPTNTPVPTPMPTPIGSGMGVIYYCEENPALKDSVLDTVSYDIYSIRIDGTQKTNLTNNQDKTITYYSPNLSPNGKKLVFNKARFIQNKLLGNYYAYEIFMMNTDGSEVQKISSYPQFNGKDYVEDYIFEVDPTWSPDGKNIYFVSNRHTFKSGNRNYDGEEIFSYNLDNFEIKRITTSKGYIEHPTLSLDGQRIAFMSNRTGNWNIFVMNSDGSGKVQNITNNKFSNRFPDWSPDGQWLVFHSDLDGNVELYKMKPDSSSLTRITRNPAIDATASWSPDGNWIAFYSDRSGNEEIYLMNLQTNDVTQLTKSGNSTGWVEWGK